MTSRSGKPPQRVGGRVDTEQIDGLRCDRGFQLINPCYPDARRALDLNNLDLHASGRGVAVRNERGVQVLADPFPPSLIHQRAVRRYRENHRRSCTATLARRCPRRVADTAPNHRGRWFLGSSAQSHQAVLL
ncbi:FAD-dependent oxidoreductase [Arthrobacter alpinus]|uniref:FAD-dependent oxidoreductase n=1 Tax=Arthrobacter alpinus TaxID=656366 RepID=UPI003B587CFE